MQLNIKIIMTYKLEGYYYSPLHLFVLKIACMDRQKPQETSDTYEADMHINPPE
jgi:hypothetical protein